MTTKQKIKKRLVEMNWRYGRGEVVKIIHEQFNETQGMIVRCIPTGQHTSFEEGRKFHIIGSTVFALGHQSNFTKPMR